jgi:hypothetical protein
MFGFKSRRVKELEAENQRLTRLITNASEIYSFALNDFESVCDLKGLDTATIMAPALCGEHDQEYYEDENTRLALTFYEAANTLAIRRFRAALDLQERFSDDPFGEFDGLLSPRVGAS